MVLHLYLFFSNLSCHKLYNYKLFISYLYSTYIAFNRVYDNNKKSQAILKST